MGADGSDSGDRRSLTEAEIEDLLARQRKADISAQRTAVLHGMELRLAELIGTDGDGGEFAHMKEKIRDMGVRLVELDTRLKTQELFTNRAKWTVAIMATVGGALAGIALFVVEHLLASAGR